MKAKTIKSILRKKVDDWLSSIDDPEIRQIAERNSIVTGGCIASMLLSEKVNDFDIYFRTKDACRAVANYYVKKFLENPPPRFKSTDQEVKIYVKEDDDGRIRIVVKSAGIASEDEETQYQYFELDPDPDAVEALEYVERAMSVADDLEEDREKPRYRPVFLSSNAITLSHRVQLVIRFYGEPDEIHENYDFVHCTNYWTSWNGELVLRKEALEALLARELRYVGSKYPLCSIFRTRKFIRRGWTINAGQYLKMAMQLNSLDLTNLDVLEDQLTGVDVAYFIEVINALRGKGKKVDATYLGEILDRMF